MLRPTLQAIRPTLGARAYSKATIVGRLGAAPIEKQRGDSGKSYFIYNVGVNKPARRDAEGKPVLDDKGYPVRDTNWFSIFNFSENAAQSMSRLQAGDLVCVEAILDTRHIPLEGDVPHKEVVLKEASHRVLSRAQKQ